MLRSLILSCFSCLSLVLGLAVGVFSTSANAENTSVVIFGDDETLESFQKRPADERFLLLKDSFEKHRFPNVPSEEIAINNHPLNSYIEAWSLLTRARKSDDFSILQKEADAFLAKHEGDYIAERFRTDWLLMNAQRYMGNWAQFETERQKLVWNRDEPAFQCWALYQQLRAKKLTPIKRKQLESLALAKLKNASFAKTNVCQRLSTLLVDANPALGFPRLLILLQQGRPKDARVVMEKLIKEKRLPAREARAAFRNAEAWYKKNQKRLSRQNKFVILLAAYQLTRSDEQKAAVLAEKAAKRFTSEERSALWSRIAYIGALNHHPKTLTWYQKAGKNVCRSRYLTNTTTCLEWRVRAALREQSWGEIKKNIAQLPNTTRQKESWLYWLGYAQIQTGEADKGKATLTKIQGNTTFYAKLANDILKKPIITEGIPTQALKKDIKAAQKNASLLRAEKFYELGLTYFGNREWNWALRGQNAQTRLAIAVHAEDNEIWHRMINTAQTAAYSFKVSDALLYPRPFSKFIRRYSEEQAIMEDWVYGLIRQESRFLTQAKSSVGANGLMQIMPRTAEWIAQYLEEEDFKPQTIYEPKTNIRFGTAYLRSLLERLDQSIVLSTTGYNAGPHRAIKWRASLTKPVEAAIFIETIPYTETRGYVQNVLANTVEYSQTGAEPINNLTEWIGVISPKVAQTSDSI